MLLDDPDNPLAAEIRQEAAATYFVACRKMVDALEALKTFDCSVSPASQYHQLTRRSQLLEYAAERVYFVIIQRQAMKLSHDEHFFERYAVPHEIRTRLSPRPAQ